MFRKGSLFQIFIYVCEFYNHFELIWHFTSISSNLTSFTSFYLHWDNAPTASQLSSYPISCQNIFLEACVSGVYIKFEIHIFAPSPFFAAAGEKCSVFFLAILYILSQLGKKYAYFLLIAFSPLFIPFQSFFPPTCYLAIFKKNRKIYSPRPHMTKRGRHTHTTHISLILY